MADWVKCSSAAWENTPIWVNLDQVVCLTKNNLGTEITYAGQDCSFLVSESPADILGNNKVRDA